MGAQFPKASYSLFYFISTIEYFWILLLNKLWWDFERIAWIRWTVYNVLYTFNGLLYTELIRTNQDNWTTDVIKYLLLSSDSSYEVISSMKKILSFRYTLVTTKRNGINSFLYQIMYCPCVLTLFCKTPETFDLFNLWINCYFTVISRIFYKLWQSSS